MATNKDINLALNEFFETKLFEIHTILPGKIQNYDKTQRKATIQPLIKLRDTKNNILQIDPIDNVPVIFPSTNNFHIIFPVKSNDGCLLLFSEASLGNYLNSQAGQIVDADNPNRFELNNCICIPGLWNFPAIPSNVQTFIEIKDDNSINIESTTGKIKIESNGNITFDEGTEPFIKGNIAKTELQKDQTLMNALQTAIQGWTPVPNDGGAALKTALGAFLAFPQANYANILSNFIKGK